MVYYWLGMLVFFLIIEAIGVQLVSIWFAAGAAVALIASAAGATVPQQWMLFVAVSGICLLAARPYLKRFAQKAVFHPTNSDRVIGKEGMVVETIDAAAGTGQVKVLGNVWTAFSSQGEVLREGALVQVDAIEGVKLRVHPLKGKERTPSSETIVSRKEK